jgi:hypothetical protein
MKLSPSERTKCEETSGFLFKHACPLHAYERCDACGKAVCEKHIKRVPAEEPRQLGLAMVHPPTEPTAAICVSCAQKLHRTASTRSGYGYRYWDDPYDPFWYSYHYGGYGHYGSGVWRDSGGRPSQAPRQHDPDDFTEADTPAVEAEGDANFEMDKSGS